MIGEEFKRRLLRHLDDAIRIYRDKLRTMNIDDDGADELLASLNEAEAIRDTLRYPKVEL